MVTEIIYVAAIVTLLVRIHFISRARVKESREQQEMVKAILTIIGPYAKPAPDPAANVLRPNLDSETV